MEEVFMRRCNELALEAAKQGDLPFGSVVVKNGEIIGEGSNVLQSQNEIDGHAERIAIREAQRNLNTRTLQDCVLYTNVEPCPMCSFPIRELKIQKVVFSIESPVMGGYTKFKVLQDPDLSQIMPDYFGVVPEIVSGYLKEECITVWKEGAPEVLEDFQNRGILK